MVRLIIESGSAELNFFSYKWREYFPVKTINAFFFLWYTAANVFIFSLALNVSAANPQKYGYGIGKETLLTPSPFVYFALFVIHILFAGTVLYVQWTERGKQLVVDQFGLGFSLLMALGTLWAGAWVRRWYIPAFVLALLVFLVATWIYVRLKRNNRFTIESDIQEHAFVHVGLSIGNTHS
ncbi:hypothetical protein FRC02_006638 [Tulasnella sp. 418]|nr:hypothetical protein FRC02_006638 [Tulasnella sp. 418]